MLDNIICQIKPLDNDSMEKCQCRLDNLTKPLGSLHAFEQLACQIAGITREVRPNNLPKSLVLVTDDIRKAIEMTALEVFADHIAAKLVTVDINSLVDQTEINNGSIMNSEQAIRLITAGIDTARREIAQGSRIIGLGTDVVNSVDCRIILECCNRKNPLETLCQLKEFHLAVLVGIILGAALDRAAVVLDDSTTSLAALIAVKLAPNVRDFLVGSHFSPDPVHKYILDQIAIPAYLHLDLGVGQGIGAALGMSLIDASLHVLNDMKTFTEAQVAIAQDGPGSLKQTKQ